MRILRVAQKCYPDVYGGGPYHVHAMSRDQAAMGHDVTVLTVRYDPDLPHLERRAGYKVARYDPAVSLLGNDVSPGLARHVMGADEFDVVHAHSHLYFATNVAAFRRVRSGIPLAITNHGLYSQNAPEWLFDLYLRSLGRWTFNRADAVFCYTEADERRLREFGVRSRIDVVSNGIDTERFTPDGPPSDLIDHDGPILLFVGRLVEGKRPADCLGVLDDLRRDHPNARLYFCGDGPLQSTLEADAVERGIRDRVSFLGHLPYEEVPAVYRSADVLVLPSRAEGLPRTVLEAMATGTPVVASDLPQVAPVVERGGTTASVGAVEEFADDVRRLLADETLRSRVGEDGRMTVEDGHDWVDTVERTTATLAELAADGAGSDEKSPGPNARRESTAR